MSFKLSKSKIANKESFRLCCR